ncbi:hypothetical protein AAZV13_18G084750 [Glycine max]
MLRAETHKFESHYIDRLGGGEKGCYERSPINHVDKFSCPIILFQGLDDKVTSMDLRRVTLNLRPMVVYLETIRGSRQLLQFYWYIYSLCS